MEGTDGKSFEGGWNYRLVRKETRQEYDAIGIHEVYYNSEDEPISCTKKPVGIQRDNIKDLKKELFCMKEAFDKPVLDYEDFG